MGNRSCGTIFSVTARTNVGKNSLKPFEAGSSETCASEYALAGGYIDQPERCVDLVDTAGSVAFRTDDSSPKRLDHHLFMPIRPTRPCYVNAVGGFNSATT